MGPQLGEIPLKLQGKMNDNKLYVTIDIDMQNVIGQVIYVQLGTDDFPQREGKVYTEPLVVTINGESTEPQQTDVTVYDNGDGTIDFELKNFVLSVGEESLGVGNIVLQNLYTWSDEDGLRHFSYNGPIIIETGDLEDIVFWMGPMLGEIPVKLQGEMNDDKLFVTIDIDMQEAIGQVIHVQLGTGNLSQPQREGKVYTEPLVVTINGESTEPQTTDVTVYDNGDGTIDFELKNFVLSVGEESLGVGNIILPNLSTELGEDGLQHFTYDGNLTITAGDLEGIEFWMGPELGEIPLKLQGKMNDDKLFVTIDIDMQNVIGQVIYVQLGTDDFAQKTERTYTEQYVVTVNEEKQEPQTADIKVVDNGDGTIDFVLPEFILHTQFGDFRIGDISLENVPAEEGEDGLVHFSSVEGSTFSVPDENIPEEWANMAIFFKNIPYTLEGNFSDEKLYATININVLTFDILVEIGTDFSDDIRGDIDGNGSVNLSDALLILDAMAEGNNDTMYDVDNSGSVNLADFLTVLDIMAEQ